MKLTKPLAFAALILPMTSHAVVTLIDHSAEAAFDPTITSGSEVVAASFLFDRTVPTATPISRVSLDDGDFYGQSFTVSGGGGVVQSIFLAYNDQRDTGTVRLQIDIDNDGSNDFVSESIAINSTVLSSDGDDTGPVFYMEFDLASENITLANGTHNFTVLGETVITEGGGFYFAPIRTGNGIPDPAYAGGNTVAGGVGGGLGGDHFFAVTVNPVPEPSSALLGLLGACSLLRRRR